MPLMSKIVHAIPELSDEVNNRPLRPWQQNLDNLLSEEPNKRTIKPIMYERENYDIIHHIDNMLMRMNLTLLSNEEEILVREINEMKEIDVDKLWIELQMESPESMSALLQGDIGGSTTKLQGQIDQGKILSICLKKDIKSRSTHINILLSRMK